MISTFVSFVIRLILTVATVVLVLSLMAVALVTMLGLVVWSLIRGRRPTIDLSGFARARGHFRPNGAGPAHPGRDQRGGGDIVDVEAREVPSARPRLE